MNISTFFKTFFTGILFLFLTTISAQTARDYGDAPRTYDLRTDGTFIPARHNSSTTLFLGTQPLVEVSKNEVLPGEDNNGLNGDGEEEDGVQNLIPITKGKQYTIIVNVTNLSGSPRTLRAWIDLNNNGRWDPEEYVSATVKNNTSDGPISLTWSCDQTRAIPTPEDYPFGKLYMRVRISTIANNDPGSNIFNDRRAIGDGLDQQGYNNAVIGEVEDYQIQIKPLQPIGCTDRTYQTDRNTFYSYAYTGERTLESIFCGNLNALGHNVIDNYIWGFDRQNNRLVKIGGNQTIAYYTVPNTANNADFYIGDVDKRGYYYLSKGSSDSYFTVDLDPNRSTYLKYVNPLVVDESGNYVLKTKAPWDTKFRNPLLQNITIPQIADWAINPVDNRGYSMVGGEGNNNYKLYKFNFQTATVETLPGIVTGGNIEYGGQPFGSCFFDSSGTFLVFGNKSGFLYKIDIENATAKQFSTAPGFETNFNDGASCVLASILPVTLVGFTAYNIHNQVQLEWKTASEHINMGFDVQHSLDGKTWKSISFVGSKSNNGNSNRPLEYKFLHAEPSLGQNYYRLKQIDYDNNFEFTRIVSAKINNNNSITIYPNPASDIVNIKGLPEKNTVVISNNLGRVLKSFENLESTFSVNDLAKGIYSISIYSAQNERLQTMQLVVQ